MTPSQSPDDTTNDSARKAVLNVIETERQKRSAIPAPKKNTAASKKAKTAVEKAKRESEKERNRLEREAKKDEEQSRKKTIAPPPSKIEKPEPPVQPPKPTRPVPVQRGESIPPVVDDPMLMQAEQKPPRKPRRMHGGWWAPIGLCIGIIVALGVYAAGIYAWHWSDASTRTVTRYLPYPAATVDGSFVRYYDYLRNVDALKQNNEQQRTQYGDLVQTLTDEEIDSIAIDKLIEDRVLESVADARGITVTDNDVDAAIAETVANAGDEETLNQTIETFYGWSRNEFIAYVIRPLILRQNLQEDISADETIKENVDAKQSIEDALRRLQNSEAFEDVATDVNDDPSASSGGSLGAVLLSTVFPEIADVIRSMSVGDASDIVQTPFGYHILRLDSIEEQEDGSEMKYSISHIFVQTVSADDWLTTQVRNASVRNLILSSADDTSQNV